MWGCGVVPVVARARGSRGDCTGQAHGGGHPPRRQGIGEAADAVWHDGVSSTVNRCGSRQWWWRGPAALGKGGGGEAPVNR
jgi:hypothetical protein